MRQDLTANLERLHTTPLGAQRMRSNLMLGDVDVVAWCRRKVAEAEAISRNGKNWYVHVDHVTITINAHSYTIITAHVDKAR